MTLYESTQIMDNKINIMYNRLYTILEQYINIDSNLTFTQLVKEIENIPGETYTQYNNLKPIDNIIFKTNDTLLRKEINIYYKIEFIINYLKYVLKLKGINYYIVDNTNTLSELIDLVDLITKIKTSVLTLEIEDTTQYYNSYCTIPYTLTADNEDIYDGNIIILEDGIEIARVSAGNDLKFLATSIGEHTYSFYYEGTNEYKPTNIQEYTFTVLPAKIRINIDAINIGSSQYNGDHHIGYDEDSFEINISTVNPYIDYPASNIPFYIEVPQENTIQIIEGVTDENGMATVIISSNKIDTFNIKIQTTSDTTKVSNNNANYSITIYPNPIKIDDYKFYETEIDKEMELYFYDDDGELTDQFLDGNYSINVIYEENEYRSFVPNINPFIISEEHSEINTYQYTYILSQDDRVIATTTNTVKINKEVTIKIVPENKFITENTEQIHVHIYTTNHMGNPINAQLQIISTYSGTQEPIITTENGYYYLTLDININEKCNGFLLQAIMYNDSEISSNTIYYRINNEEALDTIMSIHAPSFYTLENTDVNHAVMPIEVFLEDSEGEDVIRTITVNDNERDYILNYNIETQSYTGNIIIDHDIGDTITLSANFTGEDNHYLESVSNTTVNFVKSDVSIVRTEYTNNITVYELFKLLIELSINNNSNFNDYITGDLTILIDGRAYDVTNFNNIYEMSTIIMNAGMINVSVEYLGDKWTNPFTTYIDVIVNKTDNYDFEVELSNDEVVYGSTITFTPVLTGLTETIQSFNGTITYLFEDNYTTTTNIEEYTYTTVLIKEQNVIITYSGDNNHDGKALIVPFNVIKGPPSLTLLSLDYDARYREDVDDENPVPIIITYSDNNEHVPVRIFIDDIQIYYDNGELESCNVEAIIDTIGIHTIKLTTDETDIFESITETKQINTYDFVNELNDIVTAADTNTTYNDQYEVTDDLDHIIEHMYEIWETERPVKERTNNVIVHMNYEYDLVVELTKILEYYNYNVYYDDRYHISNELDNVLIKLIRTENVDSDFSNELNEIIEILEEIL